MPPKRKGKAGGAAAGKSRKAAKPDADVKKKKNAPEDEEESTRKESIGEVEEAAEAEEKKKDVAAPAGKESKEEAKQEEAEGGAAPEEKPKSGRGRKKKESAPLVPGTKRVTRSNPGPKEEDKDKEKDAKPASNAHIIIEHCRQCSSFKTRANNMQSLLIEGDPSVKISINPGKPRKGYFEIRDDTGRIFVSLKDLVRPFQELKDLDLEETAQNILKELT